LKSKADAIECFPGIQARRLLCFSLALENQLSMVFVRRIERLVLMISVDELHDGLPFILQLRNAAGVASQWMETLRGDVARHWCDIYETSNWQALRSEAAAVFCHSVTEAQLNDFLHSEPRCIMIDPAAVKVEELHR
jgi:hypothetical protein